MAHDRSFIVVAVLVLAISSQVASSRDNQELSKLKEKCNHMARDMLKDGASDSGEEAFQYAKKWFERHTNLLSNERKVIKAWKAIAISNECSSSSWKHVVLLSNCKAAAATTLQYLEEPLKLYARDCLTPEYLSKKVKSETSGLFSSDVDFIRPAFIEKYRADNPKERPLHLEFFRRSPSGHVIPVEKCCHPVNSLGAILQTVKEDLQKKGKDARVEFLDDIDKLSDYIERKLSKPCEKYSAALDQFMDEFLTVSEYFEGQNEQLVATLDDEAQNTIFRYKYCVQLKESNIYVIADNVRRAL